MAFWYNPGLNEFITASGVHDLDNAGLTYKIELINNSYTPAKTHAANSDVLTPSTNEINVTNYTPGAAGSGRQTLANRVVNVDSTNFRQVFYNTAASGSLTWTALGTGGTIAYGVIYKHNGTTESANPLLLILDFNPVVPTNGGNFTIQFASGSTQGIGYWQS